MFRTFLEWLGRDSSNDLPRLKVKEMTRPVLNKLNMDQVIDRTPKYTMFLQKGYMDFSPVVMKGNDMNDLMLIGTAVLCDSSNGFNNALLQDGTENIKHAGAFSNMEWFDYPEDF